MAFFSFFTPVLKKIAVTVAPIIVGKVTSFLEEKFNDFLSDSKSLVEATSKTLGESEAYDSTNSSLEDTMLINKKLEELKEEYLKVAEAYEILSYSNVVNQLNLVKSKIEKINKVKNNLIDKTVIKRIENESIILQEELRGTYTDEIINLISLGNTEILEILKKESGIEKEKEIKNLVEKYMTNTSSKLISKLENYMDKQMEFIQDILDTYFNNLEIRENNLKSEIKEINKAIQNGKEKELKEEYLNTLNLLESININ